MEYRAALLQAISQWSLDPIPDECLFVKFRENVIEVMTSSEAFNAINETIEILLDEQDQDNSIEILETLLSLARKSETTEIPSFLKANKDSLQNKFSLYSDYAQRKLQELFRYYRIQF